jgi:hypothetical protein
MNTWELKSINITQKVVFLIMYDFPEDVIVKHLMICRMAKPSVSEKWYIIQGSGILLLGVTRLFICQQTG